MTTLASQPMNAPIKIAMRMPIESSVRSAVRSLERLLRSLSAAEGCKAGATGKKPIAAVSLLRVRARVRRSGAYVFALARTRVRRRLGPLQQARPHARRLARVLRALDSRAAGRDRDQRRVRADR